MLGTNLVLNSAKFNTKRKYLYNCTMHLCMSFKSGKIKWVCDKMRSSQRVKKTKSEQAISTRRYVVYSNSKKNLSVRP